MTDRSLQRILYGALFLLSAVAAGAGLRAAGAAGLAFALFAALTIGGSLMCVWERSVVRSAFSLLATFLGVAGLFLLLEADFLAMAQILIYVGGVLALLLFGVMLTPPDPAERRLPRLLAGLVLIGAAVAWVAGEVAGAARWATSSVPGDGAAEGGFSGAERIGVGFLAPADGYLVAFELAAVVLTVALVAAVYIARRRPEDLQAREEGEVR
ncbi:MAG: NADH-quinone oxidoreductase subunit J [Planctomycetota bacterium]